MYEIDKFKIASKVDLHIKSKCGTFEFSLKSQRIPSVPLVSPSEYTIFEINTPFFIIAADDSPKDKFTVYESKWWCLRQHSKILNGRYKKRLKGNTIRDWIEALCGGNTVEESKAFVKNGG